MLLLFASAALAQDVAVMDFDGYGLPYDEVQMGAQGFRDAFLEDGAWSPLSEYEIASRLAAGHEAGISEARRLVAQARTELDKGSYDRALDLLKQALELHDDAGSAWARRPEAADVHTFMGQALLARGRKAEALDQLTEALYLYPGYPEHRASSLSPQMRQAFDEAEARLDEAGPRKHSNSELQGLADRLDVEAVVVGYVSLDGLIYARMVRDGDLVGEVEQELMVVPPYPGEPIYLQMVGGLLGGAGVFEEAEQREQGSGFQDISSYEERSVDTLDEAPEPRQRRRRAAEDEGMGTISGDKRRAPGADKPVVQRWWFWTGAAALAGGAGGLIYWTSQDAGDAPATVTGHRPSYTVVLEGT
jgi:tetratricopeptide (TPR) repeat protein